MFVGTFGVFSYDEKTYCIPVMRGKIERSKEKLVEFCVL